MSTAKPRHLHADYAAQFADASVVEAYSTRPPYPERVFEQLAALAVPARGAALDLGAGTGDIAFRLAERMRAVDAVEPSAAMIEAAQRRAKGFAHAGAVRWFEQTAESFRPERQYALVVAGESLHWMEWEQVLPMIARALAPGAQLAIVADRVLEGLPWQVELRALIAEHSTNRDYRPYDIGHELSARGLFRERDRCECYAAEFTQPLAAYVTSFHSRNGFSRERMEPARAAAFDTALEHLVRQHVPDGSVSCRVRSTVIWGAPAPRAS
ncbi:MAG TPA: class I SAM-dependent methyltransferase [Polyangiales bacterium]|nr:class I SAM-dependent methyltransferase [Polyangiales bacterium]